MPITRSAKKALRQSRKRHQRNLAVKTKIKKLQKQFRALLSQAQKAEAEKLLPEIFKALDKAAKEKVIKKNLAARKKSTFSKLLFR